MNWEEVYQRKLSPPLPKLLKIEKQDINSSLFEDNETSELEHAIIGWSFTKQVNQ